MSNLKGWILLIRTASSNQSDQTTKITRQIQIRIAKPRQRSARHPLSTSTALQNHSKPTTITIHPRNAGNKQAKRLGNQSIARESGGRGGDRTHGGGGAAGVLGYYRCAGSDSLGARRDPVPAARASGPDLHQASPRRRGGGGDARGASRIARPLARLEGEG